MIAEKKTLKKITIATGVVAMAVGLAATFSFEANAQTTTGGKTHDCIYWDAASWFDCSFDSNECATKTDCHVGG